MAIARLKIVQGDVVNREPAHQRAPLGRHVGDAQTRVHAERSHARTGEFDGGVQHFLVVVEATEGDDDVFAGDARRKLAFEHDLDAARNLPPELAGGPDRCGVGADDRGPDRPQRAVHVGVRIGGDDERARQHVALLDHDLVADASARRVEVDAMLARKLLHATILGQVRLVSILDIVIGGEDRLLRVVDSLGADGLELLHHGRGVVVRHHVIRADGEEVSGAQGTVWSLGHVGLRDLFNDGLRHGCCLLLRARARSKLQEPLYGAPQDAPFQSTTSPP